MVASSQISNGYALNTIDSWLIFISLKLMYADEVGGEDYENKTIEN